MIKVFLVEDEIIIREGIRYNIDWEKEGLEFVGEASDGELAYPLIQKTKPDILITDIKMPFMDGLELSRLVKQEMPEVKIIILSGYDEFEYAREGIDIGITDYLLKPVSGARLLEAVKKVGQMVEKASSDELFRNPLHPYTKALLSAIPVPDVHAKKERILLKGEITSPINPKPGCRFAARCLYATKRCASTQNVAEISEGHFVACHAAVENKKKEEVIEL